MYEKVNEIILGDCLEKLKELPDNFIDSIVTDPPYGYSFMGKDWDKVVVKTEVWKECLRVLKHGGFAFIMSAPRQDVLSHMIINLTNAGFETGFTSIYWSYATGFPKAMNISKAVDKRLGFEREITGKDQCFGSQDSGIYDFNTTGKNKTEFDKKDIPTSPQAKKLDGSYAGFQPKPAVEVILVCMKPLSEKNYVEQALSNGHGVTWLNDCRIPYLNEKDIGDPDRGKGYPLLDPKKGWNQNDLVNNITIGEQGRFPANLLVSDNVLDIGKKTGTKPHPITASKETNERSKKKGWGNITQPKNVIGNYPDEGDFSRYFSLDAWEAQFIITPKPSKSEKNEGLKQFTGNKVNDGRNKPVDNPYQRGETIRQNTHPTVKPLKLMSYLITLGSRPDDIVLDPFAGSGTTLLSAKQMGRKYIGIEKEEEYYKICCARIGFIPNKEYIKKDTIKEHTIKPNEYICDDCSFKTIDENQFKSHFDRQFHKDSV